MYVKNVNGSGRFAPRGYDSWLDYWKAQTGENPYYCAADNCLGTDLVGAHVQKANSTDKNWYIVPLCKSCNFAVKFKGNSSIRAKDSEVSLPRD